MVCGFPRGSLAGVGWCGLWQVRACEQHATYAPLLAPHAHSLFDAAFPDGLVPSALVPSALVQAPSTRTDAVHEPAPAEGGAARDGAVEVGVCGLGGEMASSEAGEAGHETGRDGSAQEEEMDDDESGVWEAEEQAAAAAWSEAEAEALLYDWDD
jgi:hypothetical protein